MKCIFCKKENNSPSIEHIIPQSISCPEGLVLKDGEVCKECNSYLGLELDSILKNYLEPWMLALGVYSINQKELKVNSFRNFVFETRNDKNPIIRVNMDRAEQSLGGG